MITAFHRELYYAHALLGIITDQGVYILDQDNTEVLQWSAGNFIYETMENADNSFSYFLQDW